MDYTLVEINKHKNKIYDLSIRLINTMDINEEFSINNEIQKETEFLLSLLNIKMNEIKTNNNMNNFNNPMMNQGNFNNNINNNNFLQMNEQMIQQQIQLQQQMMAAQQAKMQNILENINHPDYIKVYFRVSGEGQDFPPVDVDCFPNEKVSSIIEKYKNKSNINEEGYKIYYIFNAKNLNQNLTVAEACITNNANVFVVRTKKKDSKS